MSWTLGGGGGSGGFTLGQSQNIFSAATKTAAETLRDDYAAVNAAWLTAYNDDTSLNIRLEYDDNGAAVAEYQVRNSAGNAWLTNSSAKGVKGDDGAGTDFGAIPEGHIPAIGAGGLPVDSGVQVIGRDIRTDGSIQAGPSSILLGPRFKLSNGVYAVAFKLGDGSDAIGVNSPYDANGSKDPFYFKFATRSELTVNDQSNLTINAATTPYTLQYATFGDNLTYDFMFIPKSAGEFHVRYWLGASASGDLIFDEIRDVTQAEVTAGLPVAFGVGNKYILPQSTNIFVEFSGVDLAGGLVSGGPFDGQTLPYFISQVHSYEKVSLATFGFMDYNNSAAQIPPSAGVWTKITNDGAGGNTLKTYKPIGVTELVDTTYSLGLPTANNGRLLFSELSLGDQVTIRHTLNITPNSNGQTFQMRHLVGQAGSEYSLPMGVPVKMEQGGGVSTGDFTIEATIYIGDENTRLGGALPQIKLSGSSTVENKGVYISVIKRGVI